MKLKRLFLLGASTLTAYRLHRGRVCEAVAFTDTGSGHEAFARYLAEDDRSPAGLLFDRADEEFRVETVPHVWTDRAALLERHSARLFRATPFRSCAVLGREARGRRDDRVLFSAMGQPEALQPWFDCILGARVPLAVSTSVAYVSARLLTALGSPGTLLLAVPGPEYGLRQSVFVNGELRLSRLSMPAAAPAGDPCVAAGQIALTVDYARHMKLINDDADVDVHLITAPDLPMPDPGALAASALYVHALSDLAHALSCSEYAGRDAHALYAELAARGEVNRYASREQRQHYVDLRAARSTMIGSWGLALAATLAAVHNVFSAAAAFEEIETAGEQLKLMENRQALGAEALAEAARVREAVTRAEHLLAAQSPLSGVLETTGAVLTDFPEFRLDTLDVADVPGPRTEAAAAEVRPMGAYRSVWLRGHVSAPHQDGRAVGRRFDELVAALKHAPNAVHVQVLEHPFDTEGPMAGAASDRATVPARRFGLQFTVSVS